MDVVDRILADAGVRWRESLPPAPEVSAFLPALRAARPARWPRLVGVGVVLGLVAFVGARTLLSLNLPVGPAIGSSPATAVSAGDAVWGYGSVTIDLSAGTVLCRAVVVSARMGAQPSCSPNHVVLGSVDARALPGAHDIGGVPVADGLIVKGRWSGDALVVESIEEGRPALDPVPPAPCSAPSGGWVSLPNSPEELERVTRELGAAVEARRDVYSGVWIAADGSGGSVSVVGTVGDPTAAAAELRSRYPYALCVVSVEYSRDALEVLTGFFTKSDLSWQATVDPRRDRLIVDLPMVDAAAEALFRAHPEALARPLLVKR